MPVDPALVINEFGKSMLRARERILVFPSKPIVVAPLFNSEMILRHD